MQPKSRNKTLTSLAMILGEEEQRPGLTGESKPNVHKGVCLQMKKKVLLAQKYVSAVTEVTSKNLFHTEPKRPI